MTTLTADAGPTGIVAVLAQETPQGTNRGVTAYFSRPLTPTERKFPQIDQEMLATVAAIEHFRHYLVGGRFIVRTEHLPLVSRLKNPGCPYQLDWSV